MVYKLSPLHIMFWDIVKELFYQSKDANSGTFFFCTLLLLQERFNPKLVGVSYISSIQLY